MTRTAFCFDLDGTLTTTEILPCIAAELGISEEIATLTRITMEGLITFEESIRLRTAILGQVPVSAVHKIIDDIELEPGILQFITDRPDSCFVVTGNLDVWIGRLLDEKIACRGFCSRASVRNGVVSLTHILNKGDAIKDVRSAGFDKIIAVGDGSNDVPMFQEADLAIAYGGTHSPTQAAISAADFVIHNGESLCSLLKAL